MARNHSKKMRLEKIPLHLANTEPRDYQPKKQQSSQTKIYKKRPVIQNCSITFLIRNTMHMFLYPSIPSLGGVVGSAQTCLKLINGMVC